MIRKQVVHACLLTGVVVLLAAGPALAAPTASLDANTGTLTVTGEPAAEIFTVTSSATDVTVVGPTTPDDPDGIGGTCTTADSSVVCNVGVVRQVLVNAGGGDDVLSGSGSTYLPAKVQLNGEAGNDTLTSNNVNGRVHLDGGPGDDVLNAGTGRFASGVHGGGADTATGGLGNDTFNGSESVDNFAAEQGSDTYHANGPSPGPAGFPAFYPRYTPADTMTYAARTEAVSVSLDDRANDGFAGERDNVDTDIEYVMGGAGSDTLTAGGSAVFLLGVSGDDTLLGGPANDVLNGGAGNDILAGGGGDDSIGADDHETDQIDCGSGNDDATADLPGGEPQGGDRTSHCEVINGQPNDDRKPVLGLKGNTMTSKAFRSKGTLSLAVACPSACSVVAKARVRTSRGRLLTVGTGKLPFGARARTLKVKIAKRYLARFKNALRTKAKQKKGLSFSVQATASYATGITATATRVIRVRA